MKTKEWLESIGKSIDSMDANRFADFLTEDCTFRFGNQPDVIGKKEVTEYVAAFFKMIGGSEHKVVDYWKREDSVVWQGEVLYTRLDGKKVNVNFTNIFMMNGKLIKDYLIYIDNTPLFA
ncbi:MAG: nuclear transport factor 2 family protein [Ignavibacteriae bacterium]|nr:nuclear transport factor 2 family protein [Ignavibacteriota bacterium]